MSPLNTVNATRLDTKRELAKAKTRRALLKSALQLYSLEGACGMSMNKIAKGAGIAQPSFYNHFDSVETLQSELSRQLKDNYLSLMRKAWADMLGDYPTLSRAAFNQRCQHCLTLIFTAAFQNIRLFQRLLEDGLRFDLRVEDKGLGSLFTDIREEWTKIFIQGLQSAECSFETFEVYLCVDSASAQVHELILGCHQGRIHSSKRLRCCAKTLMGFLADFLSIMSK